MYVVQIYNKVEMKLRIVEASTEHENNRYQ